MKNATKLKIWGFTQLCIGVLLIVLAFFVFNDKDMFVNTPNAALLTIGSTLTVLAIPIIFVGFVPEITKFLSKMQSETIDHAKDEIKDAASKQAETVVPAVTPSIKKAYEEIKDEKTIEDKLIEAKNLLDKQVITEEEYEQMRKSILGIK